MIKKIDKVIARISGAVGAVAYVAFVAIMLLITVDVIMRKLFQISITGSYEIVERMLLILVFASFAYTQTHRGHIHVTMFIAMMPKPLRMFLFGLFGLVSAVTSAICGYATIVQGNFSLDMATYTAVLHIPLYPFYYVGGICMFVFAITLLWDSIKSFIGIKDDEVAEDIQSSWS